MVRRLGVRRFVRRKLPVYPERDCYLVSTRVMAAAMGLHPSTLVTWRRQGRGPTPIKIGTVWKYYIDQSGLYKSRFLDRMLGTAPEMSVIAAA